jgi:hypothetical protein
LIKSERVIPNHSYRLGYFCGTFKPLLHHVVLPAYGLPLNRFFEKKLLPSPVPFFTISYFGTIRLSVTRMVSPEVLDQHARKEIKKLFGK